MDYLVASIYSPFEGDGDGHVYGGEHAGGVQRVEKVREEVHVEVGGEAEGPAECLHQTEEKVEAVDYSQRDQEEGEEGADVVPGKDGWTNVDHLHGIAVRHLLCSPATFLLRRLQTGQKSGERFQQTTPRVDFFG